MAGFTAVDLSQLAPPDVVEALSFEDILADMVADLQARDPQFTALVESDPALKILQVAAYRELLLRQRVNEGARAVMLAYAAGPDLDHIGANFGVERHVIDPGDPDALPPVPPTLEDDADFRRRIQLSPEGYTTGGSSGSYVFHALGASAQVRDAQAVSPAPGQVTVYLLSREGAASVDLVDAVSAAVNAETVRPLTDQVTVQSVAIIDYHVEAVLTLFPGPDSGLIMQSALEAVEAYVLAQHRIGYDVTRSGLFAALHQKGVQNVNLISPEADLVIGDGEAAYCTSIDVTIGGTDV